jgi:hypothetical protein
MTLFGGLAGLGVDAMARPVTLNRYAPGAYVGGLWVPGALVPQAIRAVIQAPSEADIRLLPEGERTEAYVTIWSRTALMTADEDTGNQPDEIIGEDGQRYRVVRVASRTEAGFTRVIARLIRDNPERRL